MNGDVDFAKNALSESESVAVGVREFTKRSGVETKYEFRRLNFAGFFLTVRFSGSISALNYF